jgi:transposase
MWLVRADLELADRVFVCRNPARPDCGLVPDRDLNAAINVAKLAGSSSERQNACGVGSAGRRREAAVKLPMVKQEPNTFYASV